jgi:hypothetical protein
LKTHKNSEAMLRNGMKTAEEVLMSIRSEVI